MFVGMGEAPNFALEPFFSWVLIFSNWNGEGIQYQCRRVCILLIDSQESIGIRDIERSVRLSGCARTQGPKDEPEASLLLRHLGGLKHLI